MTTAEIVNGLTMNHPAYIGFESVAHFAIERLEGIASEQVAYLTRIHSLQEMANAAVLELWSWMLE